MSGSGTEDTPFELEFEDSHSAKDISPVSKSSKRQSKGNKGKNPNFLNNLPLDIFTIIVNSPILTNVDRRSLKMTSKALQTSNIQTTNPTKEEFCLFNKRFEASIPHFSSNPLAQRLLCHVCNKYHRRTKFPDAHAQGVCKGRLRTCVRCSIKEGQLNKRCFKLGDKMQFVCQACKECKVVATHMATVDKGTEFTVWQKTGGMRDMELKVNVSGRRWCKTCWKAMDGFWAFVGQKGKMKESYLSSRY